MVVPSSILYIYIYGDDDETGKMSSEQCNKKFEFESEIAQCEWKHISLKLFTGSSFMCKYGLIIRPWHI